MSQTTPQSSPRGLDRIPAHIRYPGMVVGLLVGSVCAQMILLNSALSDGGAQIEPDYYDRAVSWEHEQAARARIEGLSYTAELLDQTDGLSLVLEDATHAPLHLASGTLSFTRPHLVEPVAVYDLTLIPATSPGRFLLARPLASEQGLWDITLRMRDEQGRELTRTFRRQW